MLLISPKMGDHYGVMQSALTELKDTSDGQAILGELGFEGGFDAMEDEEMEFMIDLMETLV